MGRAGQRIESELAVEAAGQWGMFTAAQAVRLGLTRDRLSQLASVGRITHTGVRGVYRFAGAPDAVVVDDLRATWLALNPGEFAGERIRALHTTRADAVVSHLSAAHYVHGLGTQHPERLDFTIFTPRRTSNAQIELHLAADADWQLVDGLPATTIARTVADVYRDGIDAGHLGDILADALVTAAADLQAIAAALDPLTDGGGRDVVMHALAVVGAPDTIAAGNELLFAGRR
jgi:hypothetical protein